ncbi:hypothetical protein ACHAWF_015314 [Thalassiosira exigua]
MATAADGPTGRRPGDRGRRKRPRPLVGLGVVVTASAAVAAAASLPSASASASTAAPPGGVVAARPLPLPETRVARRRARDRRRNARDLDDDDDDDDDARAARLGSVVLRCRGGDAGSGGDRWDGRRATGADDATVGSSDSEIVDVSAKVKPKQKARASEDRSGDEPPPPTHTPQQSSRSASSRPRLVVEFDTRALGGSGDQATGLRERIRNRIGSEDDWLRPPHGGPALSISLDPFATESWSEEDVAPAYEAPIPALRHGTSDGNLLEDLGPPARATSRLLAHSLSLLPPLLLSRRVLNATYDAVVDYVRGRIFRTTFNRLERAYLRYYEFPAATRAAARLVSQIGILLGLSWAVRWWMILVLIDDRVGPLAMGVTGMTSIDVGMVGTSVGSVAGLWNVGLPCHGRGKGVAWLCGFVWIASVVGIGHACAVSLSVWGGPLRLQAVAHQQAENPRHVLSRIAHHPIVWLRGLEEWRHFSSLGSLVRRQTLGKGDRRRKGASAAASFDPDPLLFPATWLPLRWLQIFAVAKAFSTDPRRYRWCAPEDGKVAIPRLMKQYLIQLALGDEWHRVFLGEKRVGLGIAVAFSYFVAMLVMTFMAFTLDGGAAAMMLPSIFAAALSGLMNFGISWNRLGAREQRKALNAMGFA